MNLQSIIPWKKEERSSAHGRGNGDPFAELQRRMNSVFEDFFGRSSSDLWGDVTKEFLPRVDVSETSKEMRITAELPGLDEQDVEVTVASDMLTIKGVKKVERLSATTCSKQQQQLRPYGMEGIAVVPERKRETTPLGNQSGESGLGRRTFCPQAR